jgi:hypothetical protein
VLGMGNENQTDDDVFIAICWDLTAVGRAYPGGIGKTTLRR